MTSGTAERYSDPVRSLVICLLAVLAVSCSDAPTAATSAAPYSQLDMLVGNGAEAVNGQILVVNYTGWIYDGAQPDGKGLQFQSSIGGDPFKFVLGTQSVIAGWDRGILGMKVGGRRRLVIPPSLGYGNIRNFSIPPNATLVFEVDLVGIEEPASGT
jgi:FKBP-type peptidyl-prolyl cis-trans isomerase FkpA